MNKNKSNIKIYRNTTIYVLGAPWSVSGGPEAGHQIVYYLSKCGYNVVLAYPSDTLTSDYEIVEPYKKYVNTFIKMEDIVDDKKNVIILSECCGVEYYNKFKNIQKAIWFLSVENYRSFYNKDFTLVKKMNRLLRIFKHCIFSLLDLDFVVKNDSTVKLAASYYAYDYLNKHHGNPKLLIEPISLEFIEYLKKVNYTFEPVQNRKNIILYNPAKGDNELMVEKLKPFIPEYNFLPLKGYSHEEMIELMNKSKVYIDFGTFPGAERIPKEAVICGMCIVTGRNGASNYQGDVPIPDKYKFKDYKNQLENISTTIKDLMENYSDKIGEFEEYRQTVYNLEDNFIKQIKQVFTIIE